MRTALLVLLATVVVAAGLAFSLVLAVPVSQDAAGQPQFLHIQTQESGADPVNLTLPAGAVGALLAMAPNAIAENGQIRLGSGQNLPIDALRSLWGEVQSASGPVTVEHDGAVIRAEQTGDRVAVHVERNGQTTQAELPAAVLGAALADEAGGLDVEGAVRALAAQPGADIRVTGTGPSIRVWIDSQPGQ